MAIEAMIKASVQLEMCPCWIIMYDSFDTLFTSSELEIDPEDYPGLVNAWFEVIGRNGYSQEVAQRVFLVDDEQTVLGTLSFEYNGAYYTRKRVAVTINDVKSKYYLKVPSEIEFGTAADFRTARIVLDLNDSTRIRSQFILVEGDASSGGRATPEENDKDAWNQYTCTSTLAYGGYYGEETYGWNHFYKEAEKWNSIETWTLEVIGSVNTLNPTTFYVCLVNRTTEAIVATLSFTELVPTRKTIDISNDDPNFTSGDEYEIRLRVETNGRYGYLYRAVLYATVDPPLRAQVYMKAGTSIEGNKNYPSYDEEARWLFEPSKFDDRTKWYLEVTGREFTSTTSHLYLIDCFEVDSGYGLIVTYPSTISVISDGAIEDPYGLIGADFEGWIRDPGISEGQIKLSGILSPSDEAMTAIQLNAANDTAIVELGGFGYDDLIPDDLIIREVYFHLDGVGVMGPPEWVDVYAPSLGSGLPINGYVDAVSFVDDAQQGSWKSTSSYNNYFTDPEMAHWDLYYMQNGYPQPVPVWPMIGGGGYFIFSSDRAWTKANLSDDSFAVRVRVRNPNEKRFLQHWLQSCEMYVAGGVDIVQMDFPLVRTRVVSEEITTTLTENHRYIAHYNTSLASKIHHGTIYVAADVLGYYGEDGNGNGNGNGDGDGEEPPCIDQIVTCQEPSGGLTNYGS